MPPGGDPESLWGAAGGAFSEQGALSRQTISMPGRSPSQAASVTASRFGRMFAAG